MYIEVFDLDGTLTKEFSSDLGDETGKGFSTYSFWYLITRSLAQNPSLFDEEATAWKHMVTTTEGIDKIASSKEMTERGLVLFREENRYPEIVRQKALEITKIFIKTGIVRREAIDYLRHRLSQGTICIISTASYEEGAQGFIDGLVECEWLSLELAKRILISGNIIDWHDLHVTHMNVDTNKLVGLELVLRLPFKNIAPNIRAIFVDDPDINDRALLTASRYCFVIRTEKNREARLPDCCVSTDWLAILTHKDDLCALHALLQSRRNLHLIL